jgi:DNA repair protein RadC
MPTPKKQIQRRERLADLYNPLQTGQLTLPFNMAANGLASLGASKAPGLAGALPVYRIQLVEAGRIKSPSVQLRSSFDAARLLQDYLHDVDREHFVVLLLNRKNRCIGLNTVSIGSLTSAVVHPREVFKAAILANASAIICGHNHPSGDTEPSGEDRALTSRLAEGGKLLGIDVLDHVIVGHGNASYYSFADQNCLRP